MLTCALQAWIWLAGIEGVVHCWESVSEFAVFWVPGATSYFAFFGYRLTTPSRILALADGPCSGIICASKRACSPQAYFPPAPTSGRCRVWSGYEAFLRTTNRKAIMKLLALLLSIVMAALPVASDFTPASATKMNGKCCQSSD